MPPRINVITDLDDAVLRVTALEMARDDRTRDRFSQHALLERADLYFAYLRSGLEIAKTLLPPRPPAPRKRRWAGWW